MVWLKCGWHFRHGGRTEEESLPLWIGQGCKAVSCQKEETTNKECFRGVVVSDKREGGYAERNFTLFLPWRGRWRVVSCIGGHRQPGTLPGLKLTEWGLTEWRASRSAPPDGGVTADCCIWPTYSSHRRGQNGLDYLSELLWPTWCGVFHETLSSLSHPLLSASD